MKKWYYIGNYSELPTIELGDILHVFGKDQIVTSIIDKEKCIFCLDNGHVYRYQDTSKIGTTFKCFRVAI